MVRQREKYSGVVRYNMSNALVRQDEAGIYKSELKSECNFPEDNQTFA